MSFFTILIVAFSASICLYTIIAVCSGESIAITKPSAEKNEKTAKTPLDRIQAADQKVVDSVKNKYLGSFRNWRLVDYKDRELRGIRAYDTRYIRGRKNDVFVQLLIQTMPDLDDRTISSSAFHMWKNAITLNSTRLKKLPSEHYISADSFLVCKNLSSTEKDRICVALHEEIEYRKEVREKRRDRQKLLKQIRQEALERESADEALALIAGVKSCSA